MAQIWITVDVEAQPNRAPEAHVDRLIWGRFDTGDFGVGRMMNIADEHGVKLTAFTDLAEIDRYGTSMSDVAANIACRGHDLQLHVHTEFFSRSVWDAAGTTPASDLNVIDDDQAKCVVRELVTHYQRITGVQPLAFRGGGYRFNEILLRQLCRYGIRIDSSVNRSRATQPFSTPATQQFSWPNGMIEIPVSVVDGFRNIPRPFDFNFNSAHFATHDDMIQYVDHFGRQFTKDAIVVLVMHSWSLLDIKNGHHFGPPLLANVERLQRFITEALNAGHNFVTTADILALLEDGELPLREAIDPRGLGDAFWRLETSEPLRSRLTRRSWEPLEEFGYPWQTSSEFKPAMEAMLGGRWEKAGHFITDMRPPINFDDQQRPHACDLHAWEPVGYALRAHKVFGDLRYLNLATNFVFDWLNRYWRPISGDTAAEHLDRLIADSSTFAWYDMAVGRRIFRLAYLLDVLARDPASEEATIETLWRALQFHHAVLSREHFFRAHSNHGIHQALGQLAAARRFFHMPESASQYALARERLLQLLDEHFTSDGAHKEHSPGYHYGLMVSFVGAAASGLLTEAALKDRVLAMEEVLSWMIMPNGVIVPIGDTDPKAMVRSIPFVSQFASEGLQHQMSGGVLGTPPANGVKEMKASGYAFARFAHGAPEAQNSSYLAQIAGHHSATHKHADHLAFVWYDRGREILIDPGRYAYAGRTEPRSDLFKQGFWYSDPERIYVESTRAHNCVEIDGYSYRRKRVRPFGSALLHASEQDGLTITDCEMVVERRIRHRRVLVMAPGHWLMVLDWLHDRTAPHDFRQWFQFAPDWNLHLEGNLLRGQAPESCTKPGASLVLADLLGTGRILPPVRGQQEPELQGWTSDAPYSLVPSGSVAVAAEPTMMGRFATLIVLESDVTIDRQATRFNATMRNGKAEWYDSRGRHTLNVIPDKSGSVSVHHVTR
ncbi:heparinase II/III family protein [Stappia sp. MMSF_3263]|uniref:heparinase II/III domain-containing protein n=1 Tax=Stappia sp. MMSF_3263 TaxID=3046693 RepID=UPI00273D0A69|nr:heparinase II/III family protein [Stappia sp. MMSF_3263]